MTLNASGPISLAGTTAGQSIEIENGGNGTTQISLNCTAVRTLAGVPSGTIIMPTNFYGKSNQYTYTVSANQTNFCMRAGAVSAGWNGSSKLVVNINSGVIISSNSTSANAMTIQGSYPGGVTVTNNGTIVGMGGGGGGGTNACVVCCGVTPVGGSAGAGAGTALKVTSAVTFNNVGTIAGGGGGGGGGGIGQDSCYTWGAGGGGGGGRSSNVSNSSGGSGGTSYSGANGGNGTAGTYSSAGSGGGGGVAAPISGGNGGNWGASGGSGQSGYGGGSGGKATCGAGTYITWTGTGTRYGSIS